MICVYSEEFRTEWPQVGQVVGIADTQITVRWYGQTKEGGMYDPMYIEKGNKRVAYTSTMNSSCVITEPFELNKRRRLPKKIQDALDEKFTDFFE